jgi:cytosine/adenosine deaminase-related metal-dependent hydrolase
MILNNVKTISGTKPINIQIINGKVVYAGKDALIDRFQLTFENAIVFPGLINSHDHLDFNLFPQLGNRIYNNYTEWGRYIHENYKQEIAGILKIPVSLRIQWGIFKNLLCGVTTVVNHGERIKIVEPLITVLAECHCLHSIQFEKKWKLRLNNPLKRKSPLVIHVGEGSDTLAHKEIDELLRWNLFRKALIGVHGVAMSAEQAKKFEAVIWCPQSNYFLLNKTAPVNYLKDSTRILFGTDSTLTGGWNIWEHIRLARKTKLLSDDELFDTLHKNAAVVWDVDKDNQADVVVARIKEGQTHLESFFATEPADILLVLHKGNIKLFDESLFAQMALINRKEFSKVYMNGKCKYVQGNLPGVIKEIKKYYPKAEFPVTIDEFQPDDIDVF